MEGPGSLSVAQTLQPFFGPGTSFWKCFIKVLLFTLSVLSRIFRSDRCAVSNSFFLCKRKLRCSEDDICIRLCWSLTLNLASWDAKAASFFVSASGDTVPGNEAGYSRFSVSSRAVCRCGCFGAGAVRCDSSFPDDSRRVSLSIATPLSVLYFFKPSRS